MLEVTGQFPHLASRWGLIICLTNVVMRFRIVVSFLLSAFLCTTHSALAQQEASISKHFELVEEIHIPDSLMTGIFSANNMDHAGNILITSFKMEQWIYQRRTKKLIKLDVEQCRPGHKGNLPIGSFTPEGDIFASDYMFHFWFNKEGKCLSYVSDKVMLGSHLVPIPGRRVAFIRDHVAPVDINIMDQNGKIVRSNMIQALPNSNIAYRFVGGALLYANGYLYWANSMSPEIAMFDVNLNEVKRIKIPLSAMSYADQDITLQERSDWNIQKHIAANTRFEGFARTVSIGYHNDNAIVVSAVRKTPNRAEIVWFDSNSNVIRSIQSEDPLFRTFEKAPFFYETEIGTEHFTLRIYRLKQ